MPAIILLSTREQRIQVPGAPPLHHRGQEQGVPERAQETGNPVGS